MLFCLQIVLLLVPEKIYPRFMKNKTTTRRVERRQRITAPSRCRFRLDSVTAALRGMQTQSRPEPFFLCPPKDDACCVTGNERENIFGRSNFLGLLHKTSQSH